VQGVWDGFYVTAAGATGRIESNITQGDNRRLAGDGTFFNLGNGDATFSYRATLADPDFLTGTGETPTGRLTLKAGLETFAGVGGDAAVMPAEYHLVPSRGEATGISGLLLHPFPGIATPDMSGSGEGPFVSLPDPSIPDDVPDPNFKGLGKVQISPLSARGTFAGRLEFSRVPGQQTIFSWPLLATASDNGRVIMVAQGPSGRAIYDGVVIPPPDAESKTFIGGFFKLQFIDGQSHFGAVNFSVTR
ncbi:MAG TPA: hypothetical protein VNC50_12850, partial [Planctomycetia bacterium]|nr:hypothetical protein [Planctomycetia bacterium]